MPLPPDNDQLHSPDDDGDHALRPTNKRHSRSSIDESLELEHALAHAEDDGSEGMLSPNRTHLLDPQILADLIIQLREQMAQMNFERDDLVAALAVSQSHEAELTDALDQCRERVKSKQTDLDAARKKNEEDTEAITMLRAKVEESRRALVRLQNEATHARRASGQFQLGGPLALDLTNARNAPGSTMKSAKRGSFTPLTGSSFAKQQRSSPPPSIPGSPPDAHYPYPRAPSDDGSAEHDADGNGTARARSFPGSRSPRESLLNPLGAELDSLKRELVEARQESANLRSELREANESRLASEAMVQGLREFISGNAPPDPTMSPLEGTRGLGLGISLPPLPTDTGIDEVGDEEKPKPPPATGWGIKLWRKDSSATTTSSSSAASAPSNSSNGNAKSRRMSDASSIAESITTRGGGFWTRSPSVSQAVSPATGAPPSRKFGFLWGGASQPQPLSMTPQEKDNLDLPALSPPGSTIEDSTSSMPASPFAPNSANKPLTPDLVVQYDDTLTDNESVASGRGVPPSKEETTPVLQQQPTVVAIQTTPKANVVVPVTVTSPIGITSPS